MESDRGQILAAVRTLLPGGYDEMGKLVMGQLREWTYEAREAALAAMPPEERGTSTLIKKLTMYFWNLGKYDRVEPLCEEAVAANRKVKGDEHQNTLTAINNLSQLRKAKGDLSGVEPLMEEVLAACRRAPRYAGRHQQPRSAVEGQGRPGGRGGADGGGAGGSSSHSG